MILAGLGTRLSPGILEVEPVELTAGTAQEVRIQGYNTRFDQGGAPEIWLELGQDTICGRNTEVKSSDELYTEFKIPTERSRENIVLHLSSPKSGTYLLPDAFIIREGEGSHWGSTPGSCTPTLHEDPGSFTFPFRKILYESIRNLYFHVPMWFSMIGLMLLGFFSSIQYLWKGSFDTDRKARSFVQAGLLFSLLGLITGSIWARFTWGTWWVSDPKLNGAAITTLIYFAYLILRRSIRDPEQRARVASVYNIFAFVFLLVFLLILPRLAPESLHPGSGGNPAFSRYDLDNTMRTVFYPAVVGWFLLGLWIAQVKARSAKLEEKLRSYRNSS